jgi:hypothetical protein
MSIITTIIIVVFIIILHDKHKNTTYMKLTPSLKISVRNGAASEKTRNYDLRPIYWIHWAIRLYTLTDTTVMTINSGGSTRKNASLLNRCVPTNCSSLSRHEDKRVKLTAHSLQHLCQSLR